MCGCRTSKTTSPVRAAAGVALRCTRTAATSDAAVVTRARGCRRRFRSAERLRRIRGRRARFGRPERLSRAGCLSKRDDAFGKRVHRFTAAPHVDRPWRLAAFLEAHRHRIGVGEQVQELLGEVILDVEFDIAAVGCPARTAVRRPPSPSTDHRCRAEAKPESRCLLESTSSTCRGGRRERRPLSISP